MLFFCVAFQFLLNNLEANDERCPATWDGWQCWPDGGTPDRTEYRSCPSYISFFSNGLKVSMIAEFLSKPSKKL